jgi:hypothetical protein
MAYRFNRWREAEIMALTVYGDAGGSTHQPREAAIVIAGFMGNVERWNDFHVAWCDFLNRHQIQALHMNELSRDPSVRTPILDDAIAIITNRNFDLHHFVIVVDADDYKSYQKEHFNGEFSLGPEKDAYLFAAMTHVANIDGYCEREHKVQPTMFVYEKGDAYQDTFEEVIVERGYPTPWFPSKKDGVLPLQASDFLAAEVLDGYRNGSLVDEVLGQVRPAKCPPSKYLRSFLSMQGEHGIYSKDNLPKLKESEKILRRIKAIKDGLA